MKALSTNNRTIAKNTLFLYFRMFITMGVSLYTSRVVLNVLGVEDYGLYTVVGGVVAMFGFFNAAMSSATQRFLAINIGQKDWKGLHKTFNATLLIHIGIAIFVLIIAETLGLWFVNYKLNIPVGKVTSANFVYQFSVLSTIVTITQVPFNALIIAREKMRVFALVSIAEAVLKLLIVSVLLIISYRKLESYAVLMFLAVLLISTVYKIYCHKNFQESRFMMVKDNSLFKTLVSYSGWSLFGNIAAVGKEQGINVLLNLFFGTVINAAFGIMMQVQNAVNAFVVNFQAAVNPQIYKCYAQKEYIQMQKLMFQSSKFSYFLVFILVCPVIYNIEFILYWWLKTPPPHTSSFVVLILLNLLVECLSRPLITGAMATGNIKWYQIVVGTTLFLNFPISYLVFKVEHNPLLFLYVLLTLSVLTLLFRIFFLKKMINMDVPLFFKQVITPILLISFMQVVVLYLLKHTLDPVQNFMELLLVSLLLFSISVLLVFLIGLTRSEKNLVIRTVRSKIIR